MSGAPALPRPRMGIVCPEGTGDPLAALAVRAVELALLDRLPAARVTHGAADGTALDALIVLPGAVAEAAAAPVVRLPGDLLGVVSAGPRWLPAQLRESLLGTLRLLDRLPAEGPFLLSDSDLALVESGADQLFAAAAAADGHAGSDPLLAALVSGEPDGGVLDEALDVAVAAAVAEWVDRGMPGGRPAAAVARRAGTERALLQSVLIAEERRAAAAEAALAARLAAVEAELALTTGSASWRLTRPLRAAAQALRAGRGR